MIANDPHALLRSQSATGNNHLAEEDIKKILRIWLDKNEQTLLAQKNVGEFNGVMMQWFHWYTDDDGSHWKRLKKKRQN